MATKLLCSILVIKTCYASSVLISSLLAQRLLVVSYNNNAEHKMIDCTFYVRLLNRKVVNSSLHVRKIVDSKSDNV